MKTTKLESRRQTLKSVKKMRRGGAAVGDSRRKPVLRLTVEDVPEDLRVRLYRKPDETEPFPGGLIVHGLGIPESDPYCVEVMLDVGWNDGTVGGAFKRHTLEVLDYAGNNITVAEVVNVLRTFTRRCYCAECTLGTHLDSERIRLLRETLELRRNLARANGIPQDGTAPAEARIDAILDVEKAKP